MRTPGYLKICIFLLTTGSLISCFAVDTCTSYVKMFDYPVTNAILLSNIALSPDGRYFAESQSECTLRMISLSTGDDYTFTGANDWINAITFSPDGKYLLTASGTPKAVRLWSVENGSVEKTFAVNNKNNYWRVAYSPDGMSVAAVASSDSSLYIWDAKSGELKQTIHTLSGNIHSLMFSHDSRSILASLGDLSRDERTARIWDIASGQSLKTFSGHTAFVESAVYSHDGKYILTASYDKTACLWDPASGDTIRTFRGHTSAVLSARFSSDDRTILTSSSDATCRLWNTETGEQIRVFTIPGDKNCEIVTAEYLPDGKTILTGSNCKTTIWNIDGTSAVKHQLPSMSSHSAFTLIVKNRRELYLKMDQMYKTPVTLDLMGPDGRVFVSAAQAISGNTSSKFYLERALSSGVYFWRIKDTQSRNIIRTGSIAIQ